jgi:hypothetical protein
MKQNKDMLRTPVEDSGRHDTYPEPELKVADPRILV